MIDEEVAHKLYNELTDRLTVVVTSLLDDENIPNQLKCAILTDCLVKALHEATPETRKVIGLHWLDWASKNRESWH